METPIDVKKSDQDGVQIYEFTGELDESNADKVFEKIYEDIGDDKAGQKIVFVMSGLTYMNSKSIGYLADIYSTLGDAGGKLALAALAGDIYDTLDIVGITSIIESHETLEKAVEALK